MVYVYIYISYHIILYRLLESLRHGEIKVSLQLSKRKTSCCRTAWPETTPAAIPTIEGSAGRCPRALLVTLW